jgi:hypothetical protein
VGTTLNATSSPRARFLETQVLMRCHNLLDEDSQQQLLDYAHKLIEEQRTDRGTAASL